LSAVLPCHNEKQVLPAIYDRLSLMTVALAEWGLDYELLFVNDGSTDETPEMLDMHANPQRARILM